MKNSRELTKEIVRRYQEHEWCGVGILASGSSYNASVAARLYMEECLGTKVEIYTPFSFQYYEKIRPDVFYILISQSGKSSNIYHVIEKFRKVGRESILLTGNPESAGAKEADCRIDYGAGRESVGYVTVGYVTLVLFLMLFALETGRAVGRIDDSVYQEKIQELKCAANLNGNSCRMAERFYKSRQKEMLSLSKIFICGAGANYGTALEGALKLGETVKIPAMACETEEFLHGPNIQLTPEYAVFLMDNGDAAGSRIKEIYHALQAVTDRVYLLEPGGFRGAGETVPLAEASGGKITAEVRPLVDVVLFQCLSYWITTDLNCWKEHPLFLKMEQEITYKLNGENI